MRKFFTALSLFLITMGASAVPAKKGLWKTLPFDGTEVKAQLMGDEHMHFWQTEDGTALSEQDGTFVLADMPKLQANALSRRAKATNLRQRRVKHNAIGDFMHYTGSKKGLIILVEFSNMQFQTSNDSLLYTRICNETGFNEGRFRGSVNDYFKAQSYNQFNLTFDVVGPVQMPNTYQYYGQDVGGQGNDAHPGEMVATACQAIVDKVDFRDYDWDGDGMVDQVMCIYAGQGQADGGDNSTIWPHEWELTESDYGSTLELDSVIINTYACANERRSYSIEGIGTICHEFSHCLGLPDMYDINYGGNYGMGEWSLMDEGSYNGDGFCPSGYSSFDKYTCGWVKPIELDHNITIEAMRPLEDTAEVYMVRNGAYENEYYLLENRQQKGWDAEIPGDGMLILYVDYDREIWEWNLVNTNMSKSNGYGYPANDHQRCTVFQAGGGGSGWYHNAASDAYPYQGNDSLTNTSSPSARLYHENSDGSLLMNKGIMDITRNGDGTMKFRFRNTASEVYLPKGTLLYESFSDCNGTGGNDNSWNTTIASSLFRPDNEGWEVQKAYGGFMCARFGTVIAPGKAVTPEFVMGESSLAMLSFKAAGWNTDGVTLSLSVDGNGKVSPSEVTLESFTWNKYDVELKGSGTLRVAFTPEKRFLLDEVLIVAAEGDSTSYVSSPGTIQQPSVPHYYTLDGRYMGTCSETLPRGMYIEAIGNEKKGRKIIK